MFEPKFVITNKLLENIKKISSMVSGFNNRRFPDPVLVELRKNAEATSTHASTGIEGNPLPLTDVKKIIKNRPEHIRDSEREVLNYNTILKKINEKIEKGNVKITLNLILSIHKEITNQFLPDFKSGILRTEPVFVNNPIIGKTIYWPPDQNEVPNLINDLLDFINTNKQKIDPLIIAGIFHKQLVIIHPFTDGNGRTTRLLTKILMVAMGLNTFNLFSFENYYNQNVSRYFTMVGVKGNYYEVYKNIDFTEWLEYFTDGIIDELLRVENILPNININPQTRLLPYHQKILKYIQENGFITDGDYSKLTDRAKATRRLDLNKLISLKLIERIGKGKQTHYKLKEK